MEKLQPQDLHNGRIKAVSGEIFIVTLNRGEKTYNLSRFGKNITVDVYELLSGISEDDGKWQYFKEGDDSWMETEMTPHLLELKVKVLKSFLLNQLAIEANESLIGSLDHNKYLKNQLLKANKELQRNTEKNIFRTYNANQEFTINIFKAIDGTVDLLSDMLPHSYFYICKLIQDYKDNPEKVQSETVVELQKIE